MMRATRFVPTYRSIWLLSFPLIIASISETVIALTDAIFLSHYGTTELAALGMAETIYAMSLFLILGLVDGVQIMIGRRAGEEEHRQIGRVLNQGLYLLLIASALIVLAVQFAVLPATAEMFESAQIHAAARDYLRIAIFGLFFHAFNLALSAFYVGISRTRIFIGATLVMAGVNIVLDYLLIFGNHGFAQMGIEGAAIASLCAEGAFSLFVLADIVRRRYIREYALFVFEKWNAALAGTLVRLAAPVSAGVLVETVRWFLFFLIIERLGEEPLAAATIVFSCYALLLIPIDAFAETTCSAVSNLIGQNHDKKVNTLVVRTIALGYLMSVPVVLLTLVFPESVLSIFSEEGVAAQGAAAALMVVVLATLVAVPADIIGSAVAGTGDTAASLGIELIVSASVIAYAYYAAFVAQMPLASIWCAEVIGWGVCLLLSWFWLRSGYWKRLAV